VDGWPDELAKRFRADGSVDGVEVFSCSYDADNNLQGGRIAYAKEGDGIVDVLPETNGRLQGERARIEETLIGLGFTLSR